MCLIFAVWLNHKTVIPLKLLQTTVWQLLTPPQVDILISKNQVLQLL